MTFDKKFFAYTASGVVVAVLFAASVVQCNGAQRDLETAQEKLRGTKALLDSAAVRTDQVRDFASRVQAENQDLQRQYAYTVDSLNNEIAEKQDSIENLNDSLSIVSTQLQDCQKSKRAAKPAKKTAVKKPAQKKTPVSKQTPSQSIPAGHARVPAGDTCVYVEIKHDAPVIVNGDVNTVKIGDNAQNNNVNINNGVINNYYGAPVDTAARRAAAASHTLVVVRKKVFERVK